MLDCRQTLTYVDSVAFYEICLDNQVLCEVGVCGDDKQAQADAIARLINSAAVAHFDRCGDIYI